MEELTPVNKRSIGLEEQKFINQVWEAVDTFVKLHNVLTPDDPITFESFINTILKQREDEQ